MIKFRTPINDLESTVVGPAIVTIMNDIKRLFLMDLDTHISIVNSDNPYINKNWNVGDQTLNEKNHNRLSVIEVEYTVDIDKQSINDTDYKYNRSLPLLYDRETDFYIKNLYVQHKIELSFKVKSKFKNEVVGILNNLRVRRISNRLMTSHDVIYYITLPKFAVALMGNIVYNKNKTTNSEITLNDYIRSISDERYSLMSPMNGDLDKSSIVFKEVQKELIGNFTDDILDTKKSFDKETEMWEAEFKYELFMKIPTTMEFRYQPYVWQLMLDKAFRTVISTENIYDRSKEKLDLWLDSIAKVDTDFGFDKNALLFIEDFYVNDYLTIPSTDKHYTIKHIGPFYILLTILFSITSDTKVGDVLFNLSDLPEYSFTDEMLEILMKCENEDLSEPFQSIFNIRVFDKNTALSTDTVIVKPNLDVVLNKTLPLNGIYRLAFSIINNSELLSTKAKEKINDTCKDEFLSLKELLVVDNSDEKVIDTNLEFPTKGIKTAYFKSSIVSHILKKG